MLELDQAKIRQSGFDLKRLGVGVKAAPEPGKLAQVQLPLKREAAVELADALRRKQLARVLLEPNLVTLSGHPAIFQCGGRLPDERLPASGEPDGWRSYRSELTLLPVVLSDGRLHLDCRVDISDLDHENRVKARVRALRSCDISVELARK